MASLSSQWSKAPPSPVFFLLLLLSLSLSLSLCSTSTENHREIPYRLPSSPSSLLFPAPRPADARIIAAKLRHKAVSHHKGLFNPGGTWKEEENRNQNTLYTSTPFSSFRSFVSPFHFLPTSSPIFIFPSPIFLSSFSFLLHVPLSIVIRR